MFLRHWRAILFVLMFTGGVFLIGNSVHYGTHDALGGLRANSGGMDTSTYQIYLQQSIEKYRALGVVFSLLGGLGFIVEAYVNGIHFSEIIKGFFRS